jgi:hypothetical protein
MVESSAAVAVAGMLELMQNELFPLIIGPGRNTAAT